ncbi:TRAF3-interacting protein 1 [Phlyctochytrium bullatum]|nr:TRAF3-interacting protein 1 [Phlyctochytrium bullatum]
MADVDKAASKALEQEVQKTIELLSKIIKKPPLTAKLLAKPPFRYLHDMFMEIIKTTSFAVGLYDESETNSENVKVSIANGVEVKANPLKIVAGMEPEETNIFLQLMAKAILKKVWSEKHNIEKAGTSDRHPTTEKHEKTEKHGMQPQTEKVQNAEKASDGHERNHESTVENEDVSGQDVTRTMNATPSLDREEDSPQDEEKVPRTIPLQMSVKKRERPSSARPAPPKVRPAEIAVVEELPA